MAQVLGKETERLGARQVPLEDMCVPITPTIAPRQGRVPVCLRTLFEDSPESNSDVSRVVHEEPQDNGVSTISTACIPASENSRRRGRDQPMDGG